MAYLEQATSANNTRVRLFALGDVWGASTSFKHAVSLIEAFRIYSLYAQEFALPERFSIIMQAGTLSTTGCYSRLTPSSTKRTLPGDCSLFLFIFDYTDNFIHGRASFHFFCNKCGKTFNFEEEFFQGKNEMDIRSLLQCVALNNLSELTYELCEYKYRKQCLVLLHISLLTLEENEQISYLSEAELNAIFFNLFLQELPATAAAA